MIGIGSVAYVIPEQRLSNTGGRAETLGFQTASLLDKIGVRRISRKQPDQDTSDLCLIAAERLFANSHVTSRDIECLVVVTQNPDGHGLPHTSAIVHRKLALTERCLTFDISLGCSGYVAALAILRDLMTGQHMRNGLLLTADPYSKIIDDTDRDTTLLFGDAATATLMTSDSPVWRIGEFDFGTQSEHHAALHVSREGRLSMNGRAVFSFAATSVPLSILRTLERNGFTLEQVDRVILHQGSRYIVETIGSRLPAGPQPEFCAAEYGNTVSSSIPIAFADGVRLDDRIVVLSGFGVGLCWATTVLERIRK
jgi:3-oxoacyl-[acyl-carrier-protein] synthase III